MHTRRIVLPAGGELPYAPEDWQGCMVVIEQGMVELEARHGARRTFVAGDALWLAGLHLRVLRNRGARATVMAVASPRSRSGPLQKLARDQQSQGH